MAFAEDLSPFLTDFAVDATFTGGTGQVTARVIFDNADVGLLEGDAAGTMPRIVGRTADLGGLAHGAAIAVDGVAYEVVDSAPDGTGVHTLALRKA